MRYLIILILMPLIQLATRKIFHFILPGPYEFWQTYCMIFLQHFFSIGVPMWLLYPKKEYYISQKKASAPKGDLFRFVVLGFCMQLIGTALNYPFSMLLQHLGYPLPPSLPNPMNGLEFLLQTLVVCLTPAILEEILFRQLIYREISGYSRSGAVFYSALFFSVAHFDLFNLPATFFIGLSLGILRTRNVSLSKCCIVHFIINFTASLLNVGFNFAAFSELFNRYYPLSIFLSVVLYIAIFPKGHSVASDVSEDKTVAVRKSYTGKLLKNPLFYLYCILFFFIGVNQL